MQGDGEAGDGEDHGGAGSAATAEVEGTGGEVEEMGEAGGGGAAAQQPRALLARFRRHRGEGAARAYDAAAFCLRLPAAKLNFPDDPPAIPEGASLTPAQIQIAAFKFANRPDCELAEYSPPPETEAEKPSTEATGYCPSTGSSELYAGNWECNLCTPESDDGNGYGFSGEGDGFYQLSYLWNLRFVAYIIIYCRIVGLKYVSRQRWKYQKLVNLVT